MRGLSLQDRVLLNRLIHRIEKLILELDKLNLHLSNIGSVMAQVPSDYMKQAMKTFPSFIAKSFMVVDQLKAATATDVAKITQRARAVESAYLNQLERMGYVSKWRAGRKVYFGLPGQPEKPVIQEP